YAACFAARRFNHQGRGVRAVCRSPSAVYPATGSIPEDIAADSRSRGPIPVSVATRYSQGALEAEGLTLDKLPRHIAVIMDGNGRCAQSRGLPRVEGHRRGVKSVREIVEECARLGLEQLTLYCLSSENWKRPQRELDFLMSLLEQYVIEERSE